MRERKVAAYAELRASYARLKAGWGGHGPFEVSFEGDINNAYLASVATYFVCVPGFERELAAVGGNLQAFYRRVRNSPDWIRTGATPCCAGRADAGRGIHPPRHGDVSARQLGVVRGRRRHVRAALLRATVDAAVQPPIRCERRGQRAVALSAQRRARRGDAVRRNDIGCMGTKSPSCRLLCSHPRC